MTTDFTPGKVPALPTIDQLALLGVPANVAHGIRHYLDALSYANSAHAEAHGYTFGGKLDGAYRTSVYVVDPKQTSAGKYLRILSLDVHGGIVSPRSGSIHAFVNKATGEVSKPAGWNGPAKSTAKATKGQVIVRFSVTDEQSTWPTFDPHGGYLYSR